MKPQVATSTTTSPVFKVHRRTPELISPARPTPRELKVLSDIDDQKGLRCHLRAIFFFRHKNPTSLMIKGGNNDAMDPARVIRGALAETLVHYYPFAGRLREGPNQKLIVDCNGEGVVFVEADADVALSDLGDSLHPPFPYLNELLVDAEGSQGVLNSPLLLFQITRLKCGGFIMAVKYNHAVSDGVGMCQFAKAMGEFARGADAPSVPPVWDRHLLTAMVPARVTHVHREYDETVSGVNDAISQDHHKVERSFFFGPREISALRRLVPADLGGRRVTSFELLTSLLWRCRTIALRPLPDAEMRLICAVDARHVFNNPPLLHGYYGNVLAFAVAITTAKELFEKPLGYALRLVHDAKSSVTYEYMRSMMDLLATKVRSPFTVAGAFGVSDARRLGFDGLDFGWGPAEYGGIAEAGIGGFDGDAYLIPYKNNKGEIGTLVPFILPEPAMERFAEELDRVLGNDCVSCGGSNNLKPIVSSL